jgi:DNA-binding transcriptional ArsR family regulator
MPSAKLKNMLQYSDRLSTVFGALADPSRRAIVARLTKGSATVSELARPLPMSLSAVGQHLKVLESSGIVRTAKSGRTRTCTINARALNASERWFAARRRDMARRLDRLDAFLEEEG